jgi:hypothetical protein
LIFSNGNISSAIEHLTNTIWKMLNIYFLLIIKLFTFYLKLRILINFLGLIFLIVDLITNWY